MDKKEVLGIIDRGWIKKPVGFRIHFQKKEDNGYQTVYVPGGEDLYDSDIVAWRIAWKLSQATLSSDGTAEMVNIYVVDDAGAPIKYYATGEYHIFARHEVP